MLSDRFFKIFKSHLKWASYFFATPIVWDKKKNVPVVTDISYLLYCWLYFYALASYVVFLIVQIIREVYKGNMTELSFYYLYALAICGMFDLACALTFVCKSDMVITLLQESFKFFRFVKRDYMPTFYPNEDQMNCYFDLFLISLRVISPICGLVIGLHSFIYPEWSVYVPSLFIDSNGIPILPRILWILLVTVNGFIYSYAIQMIWANLLIFADISATLFWYAWVIHQEFFCKADETDAFRRSRYRYLCTPQFRQFHKLPSLYNQFQVLYNLYEEVTSFFIVPCLTILINLILFCNFSMIRNWERLDLTSWIILGLWSGGATFTAFITITLLGCWYVYNKKVLRSIKNRDWGNRKRNLEMRRYIKSCRVLSFGMGKFYVIRRVSILKFLKRITRGTLRALLTIKR